MNDSLKRKIRTLPWYRIALITLFFITVFFRFYNYHNRWGLASDQARDAIIVERSIQLHSLPLIGPFSASGPFVFGPSWYLIFIFFTAIYPQWILTPWVIQSIFFVLVVFLMVKIGNEIEGKYLGLLLGLFTAISTAQIGLSTNLVFSALASCIAALCLYLFVLSIKKENMSLFFFLGLTTGTAITVHFQTIPLIFLPLIALCMKKMRIRYIITTILGIIIPFIPLIIFDTQTNFFESSHLFQYFFLNDSPSIITRWLFYAGQYWPESWANIIGGYPALGYLIIFTACGVFFYLFLKKRVSQVVSACFISFLSIFILLRYFHGVLFEGFLSFLHPLVLFISAWTCFQLIKLKRIIGILLTALIIITTTVSSISTIVHATNHTDEESDTLRQFLEQRFPQKKFALYDYEYTNTSQSLPLSLFIYMKQENNPRGIRIGLANREMNNTLYPLIYYQELPYPVYLYDLNHANLGDISRDSWVFVNPRAIYSSVEEWYK